MSAQYINCVDYLFNAYFLWSHAMCDGSFSYISTVIIIFILSNMKYYAI